MNRVIIYCSKYGATKSYAEKLASLIDAEAKTLEEVGELSYEEVIFMGGLYAGKLNGLSKLLKVLPSSTNLVVITVGIAGVSEEKSIQTLDSQVLKQLPDNRKNVTKIFHLRGMLDYKTMSKLDTMMMGALTLVLKSKPLDKRDDDANVIINSYKGFVDKRDFDALNPIVNELNK